MIRYLYTREAAKLLKVRHLGVAWRILRDAGVVPVGKESGPPLCIWRAEDVARVVQARGGRPSHQLRREATIRRWVAHRRAKREQVA